MSSEFENHEIWMSFGGKGGSARGTVRAKRVSMRRMLALFSEPSVDNSITYGEYMKLGESKEGKQVQADKKAQPGFVIAGKFKDGRRKITHQIGRSAIQIDIDHATPEQAEFIRDGSAEINEWGYLWHTTRAHCLQKPRIRILVPLTRMVNGDEANALTRLLALTLADDPEEAIEVPDLVSFRYNQIMYRPSISKGQDFAFGSNDAPILNPDEFLAANPGWDDITKLPRQEAEKTAAVATGRTKMEDPTEKEGLIGAFCRAYSVEEAIAEFLPDIYTPGDCSTETRYTYTLGSAANGLVIYDDGLFAYSHHGTDPAEGQNNAWDLVRKHLFIEADAEVHGNTSPGNMPSFKAMSELARDDKRVMKERAAAVSFDDFDDYDYDDDEDGDEEQGDDEPSVDDLLDDEPEEKPRMKQAAKAENAEKRWQEDLTYDKSNAVEKTKYNAILIVTSDKRIAPGIALNELTGGPDVLSTLRFSKVSAPQAPIKDFGDNTWASPDFFKKMSEARHGRKWTDTDTAALAYCLSAPSKKEGYGRDFTNQDLQQAMLLAAQKNRYNPVLNRLRLTGWDGEERVETFFIDRLGCEDNAYHRELARLWFLAAVTRVHEPGHKFDMVPILGGSQGGGKSGVIECLGMGFFGHLSGDFGSTQKMVESTRGKWILEVPELKGFHRGMIEDIKMYFSANSDTVRLAYRTNEEDFYRRCVYMGTTNQNEYLRDDENRRFCPVLTKVSKWNVVDFDGPNGLKKAIPQLWAEALVMYAKAREKKPLGMLDLTWKSVEAKKEAHRLQTEARETQPHESVAEVIEEWVNTPLSVEAVAVRDATVDEFEDEEGGPVFLRNLVTVTEVRRKLDGDPVIRSLKMNPDKVIAQALRGLEGWKYLGNVRRCGKAARWYVRVGTDDSQEFVPLSDIPGLGSDPSVDDLLG